MVETCDTSLIWGHLQKAEEDVVRYSSVVRAASQAEAGWETPGPKQMGFFQSLTINPPGASRS